MRRSNADKRKAVETLLADSEWVKWSDREVSRSCGVSISFVGDVRRSLSAADSDTPRTYTTKHGTQAVMNTANIGKKKPNIIERLQAQVDAVHGAHVVTSRLHNPVADPKAQNGVANKNGGTNGGKFYLSFL